MLIFNILDLFHNFDVQKYEKAGDDEGDLLPFLNNPFSAYSVLPFEDWVVV